MAKVVAKKVVEKKAPSKSDWYAREETADRYRVRAFGESALQAIEKIFRASAHQVDGGV
jgi:hypothetical protein